MAKKQNDTKDSPVGDMPSEELFDEQPIELGEDKPVNSEVRTALLFEDALARVVGGSLIKSGHLDKSTGAVADRITKVLEAAIAQRVPTPPFAEPWAESHFSIAALRAAYRAARDDKVVAPYSVTTFVAKVRDVCAASTKSPAVKNRLRFLFDAVSQILKGAKAIEFAQILSGVNDICASVARSVIACVAAGIVNAPVDIKTNMADKYTHDMVTRVNEALVPIVKAMWDEYKPSS